MAPQLLSLQRISHTYSPLSTRRAGHLPGCRTRVVPFQRPYSTHHQSRQLIVPQGVAAERFIHHGPVDTEAGRSQNGNGEAQVSGATHATRGDVPCFFAPVAVEVAERVGRGCVRYHSERCSSAADRDWRWHRGRTLKRIYNKKSALPQSFHDVEAWYSLGTKAVHSGERAGRPRVSGAGGEAGRGGAGADVL